MSLQPFKDQGLIYRKVFTFTLLQLVLSLFCTFFLLDNRSISVFLSLCKLPGWVLQRNIDISHLFSQSTCYIHGPYTFFLANFVLYSEFVFIHVHSLKPVGVLNNKNFSGRRRIDKRTEFYNAKSIYLYARGVLIVKLSLYFKYVVQFIQSNNI